jgi:signal transduction histidine kinase
MAMFGSLRARLLALVLLLIVASIATGFLMVGLFRQSTSARVGQAEAELQHACDSIGDAYRFYSAGWHGSDATADTAFRGGLITVVQSALRQRAGIEGGIWRGDAGSLAYAYPTYEGSGPKTDLPQAELPRIQEINRDAANEDRSQSTRYASRSQTLVLAACPLSGPIPHLTAWTMTRVVTFAGRAYGQLMMGLAVLLATVLATAALLTRLTLSWTRHIGEIRATLSRHDLAELPRLPSTGERELDQIVSALNDAGTRLGEARKRAEALSQQVATTERMAAIGRVAAGVAHEIRNPIAAMRLKAENAIAKGGDRYPEALAVIIEQIARLDRLLSRLLNVTEPDRPNLRQVDLGVFLDQCLISHCGTAEARGIRLQSYAAIPIANFDPELMHRALDNLLSNAIQAAPRQSLVEVSAKTETGELIISVCDEGSGAPSAVRERLFEPFVTGRTDGTGLGLSIVREVAEAHGGSARYRRVESKTIFEIVLPWQPS